MRKTDNFAIAVIGPTAVGKTQVAIDIAREFRGEIVSCDSVQIYKELDIGSAKPSDSERSAVAHHLIDVFSPDFRASVGEYKTLAENAISDIISRGKLPVVAGGTGLYFNALYYGLFRGVSSDKEIRNNLENEAKLHGLPFLYEKLKSVDPSTYAKVHCGDKRRIIRALEAYYVTGCPLSDLQSKNEKLGLDWHVIGLNIERKKLYERIEARVDKMFEAGLVDETRALIEKFGENAYALGSIGYRHCLNYIKGLWSLDETVGFLKRDTRRYAKRQLIWFRKLENVHWFNPSQLNEIKISIENFFKR
jgi:tRNA dimethylallyltransferase